jgi:hypothetical protein
MLMQNVFNSEKQIIKYLLNNCIPIVHIIMKTLVEFKISTVKLTYSHNTTRQINDIKIEY